MKKMVKTLLFTALMVPCLAGCDNGPVETRSEEEIIIEKAGEAIGQVCIMYNDFSASAGIISDQKLQVPVTVDGYQFKMEYALTANEDYGEGKWASLADAKDGNKTLKVVVPATVDLPGGAKFAAYTMAVTPVFEKYADDFVVPKGLTTTETYFNKSYTELARNVKIRINAAKTFELPIAELYTNKELKSKESRVITYGIYNGTGALADQFTASSTANSLYFDDGEYTVVGYNSKLTEVPTDLEVGKVYKIIGTYTNYYDTIELSACTYEPAPEHTEVKAAVIGKLTADNLKDLTHSAAMTEVTGTILRVAVSYGKTFEHTKTKASVYVNVTGATDKDGNLVEEAYAYVHQFDLAEDYASWSTRFDPQDEKTYKGATVKFIGRWYWYSGAIAFYHSRVIAFTAPVVA